MSHTEHHTYFVAGQGWDFSVWAHNICIGRYGSLVTRSGFQRNHINQNGAFRGVIPPRDGIAIYLQGGTNVVGSTHYRFHQSLNRFWKPYQENGALFGTNPTIRQYNAALRTALDAAGKSSAEIRQILYQAIKQQRFYGLIASTPVPRVPGT